MPNSASKGFCLPAVAEGTSRPAGSDRTIRPAGEAVVWPSANLFPFARLTATINVIVTSWLSHAACFSSLLVLSRRVQADCEITAGGQKWRELKDDLCTAPLFCVGVPPGFCEYFIHCVPRFNILIYLFVSSFLNKSGSSWSHWAQRRQRRGRPSSKTIISHKLLLLLLLLLQISSLTSIYFHPFLQTGATWAARFSGD